MIAKVYSSELKCIFFKMWRTGKGERGIIMYYFMTCLVSRNMSCIRIYDIVDANVLLSQTMDIKILLCHDRSY